MHTDWKTWIKDNSDNKIFRMWEYRRPNDWTPYEQERKFSDQCRYVDYHCNYIIIKESIELPDGDILLGFYYTDELPFENFDYKSILYKKLSEIELQYYINDDKNNLELLDEND